MGDFFQNKKGEQKKTMQKKFVALLAVILLTFVVPMTKVNAAPSNREVPKHNPIQNALELNTTDRVFYFPSTYKTNYDSIDVAGYQDWNFTWRSMPEMLELQLKCDTISAYAVCENESVDYLTLHISDWSNHDYDTDFSFPANGSLRTLARSLPEGLYQIYATGDSDITKTHLVVVFSQFDTSIISLEASSPKLLMSTDISQQPFLQKRKIY